MIPILGVRNDGICNHVPPQEFPTSQVRKRLLIGVRKREVSLVSLINPITYRAIGPNLINPVAAAA